MNRFFRPSMTAIATAMLVTGLVAGGAIAQDSSPPAVERQQDDERIERKGPAAPAPADRAKRPAKKASPLDLLMKDGIPRHAEKRAVLREDLYALLATSANAEEAKKIAAQIERIWRASGSDTITVLMSRAARALQKKDQKLALTLLDSVVELAPDHAEAWNRRAFLHYSAKNFRAAVGDLRRALALDKNHFKALDGLASIFQQIGDDEKALKVYERLRDIHPFWPGLEKTYENLKGKVEGRGI